MWLAEILVYTAPVSLHPAPGHGQAGPVRINSSPQCTREPVTQCPYTVLLETEIQSKQCTAFTSNPAEVWLVDIKGFVRHVCWQPQPTIFSCPWQCMNASMPPRALWKYTAESWDLGLNLFPKPKESTSASHFYQSPGVCRLNPYSKRPRTWRTVFVRSRGKPQDRWLSRQGNRCAEQVSDENDSTEYFLLFEQEEKIIIRANG